MATWSLRCLTWAASVLVVSSFSSVLENRRGIVRRVRFMYSGLYTFYTVFYSFHFAVNLGAFVMSHLRVFYVAFGTRPRDK